MVQEKRVGIGTLQETTNRYSRVAVKRRIYSRARMRLSIKSYGRPSGVILKGVWGAYRVDLENWIWSAS